ncbi:hypothetical protein A1Q2_06948 [Trichosporon asahii var. asahii CBS 8904]|nr:hypothetical protein A1Q2_06948 [Trichosporon asahii var. asahii CBS 8904]
MKRPQKPSRCETVERSHISAALALDQRTPPGYECSTGTHLELVTAVQRLTAETTLALPVLTAREVFGVDPRALTPPTLFSAGQEVDLLTSLRDEYRALYYTFQHTLRRKRCRTPEGASTAVQQWCRLSAEIEFMTNVIVFSGPRDVQ